MTFEIKPGTYRFAVKTAEETVFKSGNEGIKVELEVDIGTQWPKKCFENFIFKNTTRLEALCASIGVEFPPENRCADLIGKSGEALFTVEKYFSEKHQKEFDNLKIQMFILSEKSVEGYAPKQKPRPGERGFLESVPPLKGDTDDNVPF
jgi:hypothetical protein